MSRTRFFTIEVVKWFVNLIFVFVPQPPAGGMYPEDDAIHKKYLAQLSIKKFFLESMRKSEVVKILARHGIECEESESKYFWIQFYYKTLRIYLAFI
jgi:hypothetical protein